MVKMWTKGLPLIFILLLMHLQFISSGGGSIGIRAALRARLELYRKEVAIALNHFPLEEDTTTTSTTTSHSRYKRATITADNPLSISAQRSRRKTGGGGYSSESLQSNPGDGPGGWIVGEIIPSTPPFLTTSTSTTNTWTTPTLIQDFKEFQYHNQSLIATLVVGKDVDDTLVLVQRIKGVASVPVEIAQFTVQGFAKSLSIVEIDDQIHLLPLGESSSPLLRLDTVRKSLVQVQIIPTPHVDFATFWNGSGEEANGVWLGLVPSSSAARSSLDGVDRRRNRVNIDVYQWQGGYLDATSTIAASAPTTMEHFKILNSEYIGVANYMDDSGSTSIHSELFKWVHRESSWVSFQRIRTFGAKDIKHFSFDGRFGRKEHFLAIANHCVKGEDGVPDYRVKSLIMKWGQHRFVPFKSFYTRGALQFLPLVWDDKFVLVLLEFEKLRLFQYNGWSFSQVKHYDLPPLVGGSEGSFYGLRLHPFQVESFNFVVSSSNSSYFPSTMFHLNFTHKNDHSKLAAGMETWCVSAKARLDGLDLNDVARLVAAAPKTDDKEVFLDKSLSFRGPLAAASVNTKSLIVRGLTMDQSLASKLALLEDDVDRKLVAEMGEKMSTALYRNHSAKIPGSVTFSRLEYSHPILSTEKSQLGIWNGIDVGAVVGSIILSNAPNLSLNSISAPFARFAPDLVTVGSLNGATLSDYATKNRGADSSGMFLRRCVFRGEVELGGNSSVGGNFAGVDFKSNNFLLATGNQTLGGVVRLEGVHSERLYSKLLNGEDISYYFDDAVPLDGDAILQAPHSFESSSIIRVGALEFPGAVFNNNGINVTNLFNTAIRTRGKESQRFKGSTRFRNLVSTSVTMDEGYRGGGLVNGKYNLSKDFVSADKGDYTFGEVVLLQGGNVEALKVVSKLGRLDVGSDGDFGLFLKNSPTLQHVKMKRLGSLHFEQDVTAEGLFAGVKLSDWSPNQRIRLRSYLINRKVRIFGSLSVPETKVTSSLTTNSSTTPTQLLPLILNAASKNGSRLPGKCELIFSSLKVVGDSTSGSGRGRGEGEMTLNEVNPNDWLLKSAPTASIKGTKYLLSDLFLTDNVYAGSLQARVIKGGEDILDTLPNLLVHGSDQVISGPTTFLKHPLEAEILDCPTTTLSGIPFSNLLLKSGDQIVDVATGFKSLVGVRSGISIATDLVVPSINGGSGDLKTDIEDTLRTSSPKKTGQIISGEYSFDSDVSMLNFETGGLVEGVEIGKLFSSLVRRDRKKGLELQSSNLLFFDGLTTPNFDYRDNLNLIPASEWGHGWLLTTSNQTVTSRVRFSGGVKVDEGVWSKSGRVGGVDVVYLNKNTLRTDTANRLRNVGLAEGGGSSWGSGVLKLGVDGRLNGVKVDSELVVRNKPSQITGVKKFVGDSPGLHVLGNVETQLLDGSDVSSALHFLYGPPTSRASKTTHKGHKLKVKGDLHLPSEPVSAHSVNGQEWKSLLKSVWFTNQPATIVYPPSFQRVVFSGGAVMEDKAKLGGVALTNLQSSYASKTKNQVWSGSVVLQGGPVSMNVLATDELKGSNGHVNGVLLPSFLHGLLSNGSNQTVSVPWSVDHLNVNRLNLVRKLRVNGVDLDKIVSLHGQNVIPTFSLSSLSAEELTIPQKGVEINGVELGWWEKGALKREGNIVLKKPLVLDSGGHIKYLRVANGYVDGVDVSRLLLKSGSQNVVGRMRLDDGDGGDLWAPGGIHLSPSVPLNKVPLNSSLDRLLLKSSSGSGVVDDDGSVTFASPLYAAHLKIEEGKQFLGQNLSRMLLNYDSGSVIPKALHFRAKDNYEALTSFSERAIAVAERRAVWIEYWSLSQVVLMKKDEDSSTSTSVLPASPHVFFLSSSPSLLVIDRGDGGRGSVSSGTWRIFSETTETYDKIEGESLLITGGVVVDIVELDWDRFALSLHSSSSPISVSIPKASNHKDIYRGGPGRQSRVVVVGRSGKEKGWSLETSIHGKHFGKLQSVGGCLFLSAPSEGLGHILCGSPVLAPFQSIPLSNPALTTSLELRSRNLLLVSTTTTGKVVGESEGVIEVWSQSLKKQKNKGGESHSLPQEQFVKKSCIPVVNVVSMDGAVGPNHSPWLAVASSPSAAHDNYGGAVILYRFVESLGEFEKSQTLNVGWPLEVRLLVIGGGSREHFLVLLTRAPTKNLQIFKFHGVAGWSFEHSWSNEGSTGLGVGYFSMGGLHRSHILLWGSMNETLHVYSALYKGIPKDNEEDEEYEDEEEEQVVEQDEQDEGYLPV